MSHLLQSAAQSFADADIYHTYDTPESNSMFPQFFGFAALILIVAGTWRVFTKAKQPGWAAIIPIYNTYITLKIINRPWWWLLLLLIPVVNFIVLIMISNDLSKAFGKGVGYTLLLIFLPFIGYPMLGFGDAKYMPLRRS